MIIKSFLNVTLKRWYQANYPKYVIKIVLLFFVNMEKFQKKYPRISRLCFLSFFVKINLIKFYIIICRISCRLTYSNWHFFRKNQTSSSLFDWICQCCNHFKSYYIAIMLIQKSCFLCIFCHLSRRLRFILFWFFFSKKCEIVK